MSDLFYKLYDDGRGDDGYSIRLWWRDGRYTVMLFRGMHAMRSWHDRAWFRRRSVGELVRKAIAAMMADRERRQMTLEEAGRAVEEAHQAIAIEAEVMQALHAIEGRAT